MAKKCMGCNSVFDDTVVYCPNCGRKVEQQEIQQMNKPQKSNSGIAANIDWSKLYKTVFYEYGLLTASIIALIWSWNWGALLGTAISVAVLVAPVLDKSRVYKALWPSRILAGINIVLGIAVWLIL